MKKMTLRTAVNQIKRACEQEEQPFFFIVGAGISYPPVPLASQIIDNARNIVRDLNDSDVTDNFDNFKKHGIDEYSYWFEKAYPQPISRQRYLRTLIENKPISSANLRLAHLLIEKKIANIVITPNFDDFLSRALTLFGSNHIISDHPQTAQKIDPEQKDIQILHVHGTYMFYDCCNLRQEIETRASSSEEINSTMSFYLDSIMLRRSPIVVGYNGWEGDVIMSSLKLRLKKPLKHNIYWFCYTNNEIDSLPGWLKNHPNVVFVVPNHKFIKREESDIPEKSDSKLLEVIEDDASLFLPAQTVFEAFIKEFNLNSPNITLDPIAFYENQLKNSLIENESFEGIYFFKEVLERLNKARKWEQSISENKQNNEKKLGEIIKYVRESQYEKALKLINDLEVTDFSNDKKIELIDVLQVALSNSKLLYNEKLISYNLIIDIINSLNNPESNENKKIIVNSNYQIAICLNYLNKKYAALDVLNNLIVNYKENKEYNEIIVGAIFEKAKISTDLKEYIQAIDAYDFLIEDYSSNKESIIVQYCIVSVENKVKLLKGLNRESESIELFMKIIERYKDYSNPIIQKNLINLMYNLGVTLNSLKKYNESNVILDELITKYKSTTDSKISIGHSYYVMGMNYHRNNQIDLGNEMYDNSINIYDEIPSVKMWVVNAMYYKALFGTNDLKEKKQKYLEIIEKYNDSNEEEIIKVMEKVNGEIKKIQ